MILGIVFGFVMTYPDWGASLVSDWIQPFGNIFVKLLKLIAIPLIIASLIKGISDLKDISKFRNIGLRTIGIYIGTTVVAISIGLMLVNILKPGDGISESTILKLSETYAISESNIYDLGCSLGAATFVMRHRVPASARIIAVDNSQIDPGLTSFGGQAPGNSGCVHAPAETIHGRHCRLDFS